MIQNAGVEYKCVFSKPDNLVVPEKKSKASYRLASQAEQTKITKSML
jgi:hypothetical protein